jgi:hypothetical protein
MGEQGLGGRGVEENNHDRKPQCPSQGGLGRSRRRHMRQRTSRNDDTAATLSKLPGGHNRVPPQDRWWLWNTPYFLAFKPIAKSRKWLSLPLNLPLMPNQCKDVQSLLFLDVVQDITLLWKMDLQLLKKIASRAWPSWLRSKMRFQGL